MLEKCPICGTGVLGVQRGEFRFEPPPNIPGATIIIENAEWEECGNSECGEKILSPALSNDLERVRYGRLGLRTPQEIKAVRERAGKSQADMAELLGVGEKTYTRWESGRSIQNKSSDNLIRLADRHPELFLQMEAQRNPERGKVIRGWFEELQQCKNADSCGMAAHGANLEPGICELLRDRLRKIVQGRKKG